MCIEKDRCMRYLQNDCVARTGNHSKIDDDFWKSGTHYQHLIQLKPKTTRSKAPLERVKILYLQPVGAFVMGSVSTFNLNARNI